MRFAEARAAVSTARADFGKAWPQATRMLDALRVVGRAFSLWWGELLLLTVLNLAWLVLQIPIVTGPPATAAIYAIARRIADGELVGAKDAWLSLRQMFWPAWGWGLLNGIMAVVIVSNFAAY